MSRLIKQKLDDGHQIILLADINDDVTSDAIEKWAEATGIKERVSEQTPHKVPTSQRGSTPIDGIFTSHSIEVQHAGYLEMGMFPSDHRTLWVDINYDHLFGFKLPKNSTVTARKLQCQIPQVRQS